MKEQFSGLMRATVAAAGSLASMLLLTDARTLRVTTVRPRTPKGGDWKRFLPDRMSYTTPPENSDWSSNNLRDYQITGGRLDQHREVGCRRKKETPLPARAVRAMLRMLQTLLEDRFQLRFHRETKSFLSTAGSEEREKLREFKEGEPTPAQDAQGEIAGGYMRTLAFFWTDR